MNAIQLAAHYNRGNIIPALIEHGANIECEDNDTGCTPLMRACALDCREAAKMLLVMGADPSKYNRKGEAAIHVAAEYNLIEIAKLLLDFAPQLINQPVKHQK